MVANKLKKTFSSNALQNWYFQRITAVVILISLIGLLVPYLSILCYTHDIFLVLQKLSHCVFTKIMLELFIICACWHGFIGISNVFMDYVKCSYLKILLKVLLLAYLLSITIYSFYAIWL